MAFEQVISRLESVRRSRWGWMASCPAHEDNRQSLSVRISEKGDLLLKCHAGCTFPSVISALGIDVKDCYAERQRGNAMPREAGTYDYKDEKGKLLFQVVRFEPKDFRQRTPDGTGKGWKWGLNGARRVLYRLPELVKSQGTVLVVEGEKDVDRLLKEGLVATCNPMGAGKWCEEYTSLLLGRTVVVVPDNDPPGEEHAQLVLRCVKPVTLKAVILRLSGLPDKGDVSDWFSAGHTASELRELCTKALSETETRPRTDIKEFVQMGRTLDRKSRWLAVRQLIADLETDE